MYKNNGLMGLSNLGNTCYMNSVLQFLSHIYLDMDIIESLKSTETDSYTTLNDKISSTFYKFLKNKWLKQDISNYNPKSMKNAISKFNKTFIGNDQHDSHELLIFMLDNMEKDNPFIKKHFQGQFVSILECPKCEYKSKTKEPFYTLNVEINYNNLKDCLRDFFNSETLDNNNCWNCNKCKKDVNATKKITISKYPKNLIIVLKRFSYDRIGRRCNKQIQFPLTFNKYKLKSFINHYGSYDCGHYTAIGKSPINNKWIHYNDTDVSYINCEEEEERLRKFGISAYILLYEK